MDSCQNIFCVLVFLVIVSSISGYSGFDLRHQRTNVLDTKLTGNCYIVNCYMMNCYMMKTVTETLVLCTTCRLENC